MLLLVLVGNVGDDTADKEDGVQADAEAGTLGVAA